MAKPTDDPVKRGSPASARHSVIRIMGRKSAVAQDMGFGQPNGRVQFATRRAGPRTVDSGRPSCEGVVA